MPGLAETLTALNCWFISSSELYIDFIKMLTDVAVSNRFQMFTTIYFV